MAQSHTTIALRDRSYRWIDVKHVPRDEVPGNAPEDVLRSLLGHPAYRDTYMAPDSETDLPMHGPYDLDMLSVASFHQVTRALAEEAFNEWLTQFGPVPSDLVDGDLQTVLSHIRGASTVFRLLPLAEDAHHEPGWIVGQSSGFLEIVVIHPDELILIVCSDD